ncbi:MAG TPA: hypothetical protein DIV86_06540 [Alphaproteobacteria bacterium]|nr:hypothetical protein [Alphaproteobacteria bacterium]
MTKHIFIFLLIYFVGFDASANNAINYRRFFDDSVQVGIPENFEPMPEAEAIQRFPDQVNRPKHIFMSPDGLATISLNMAANYGDRQTIIHFFRDIKNDIRANYPDSRFLKTDVIRNRSLALVEYTASNPSGDVLYNMMAFRYVGDNFFFFNFTCPEKEMEKYQQTAREIAQDIELVGKKGY